MLKKLVQSALGLGTFLVIALALAGAWFLMMRPLLAGGAQQQQAENVSLGRVVREVWEDRIPAVGSVAAFQGVIVSAEADGVVRSISFEPGAQVEAGAPLVQLDVEVQESQLRAAEASADLAHSNAVRAEELFASRTISRADVDAARATLKQAQAQVDNVKAIIAKRTVRAPFAGRLGIREISVGQFVTTGQAIVSLQSLDPVYVEFSLPQQHLAQLSSGLEIRATSDAYPGEVFAGTLTAINPDVDAATRNLRMQATMPNPDGRLRPGMFVNAEVILPEKRDVLIVPSTAILYAPYGDTIFVTGTPESAEDGSKVYTVEQKIVRLGERRGDFVAVRSGLEMGDQVVTNGAFKLRNGSKVVESPIGAPAASLNPTPPEA